MANLIKMPRAAWRRQPNSAAEIDYSNSLANRCEFIHHINTDLVSKEKATLLSSTNYSSSQHGLTINCSSTTSSGFYYPASKLKTISHDLTVFCIVKVAGIVDYSCLLGVPHNNGTAWPDSSNMYLSIIFQHNKNTSGKLRFQTFANSTSYSDFDSPSLTLTTSNDYVFYAASKRGASCIFQKNNIQETSANITTSYIPDLSYNGPIIIGNRNPYNTGEGINGSFLIAGIFSRALERSELYALYENPWQIFKPSIARFISIPSASPFKPAWARSRSSIIGSGV